MNFKITLFWFFSVLVLIQPVFPINNPENKINQTYIFDIRLDHVIHSLIFVCWMILYKLAYFANAGTTIRNMFLYIVPGLLIAFLSEALQLVVPYRVFNMKDLIANVGGVVVCFPLIFLKLKNL